MVIHVVQSGWTPPCPGPEQCVTLDPCSGCEVGRVQAFWHLCQSLGSWDSEDWKCQLHILAGRAQLNTDSGPLGPAKTWILGSQDPGENGKLLLQCSHLPVQLG